MKLQNLSVIFIIIVIPLILVVSYYISLQVDTLNMQSAYNTKLLESTKEAIDAFEINTVEWNSEFSQTADSKRRDIMASINTFISSFANNIGVGGTSKEYISAYIPAISYTLYDGYYIYAPTNTKQSIKDKNGLAVTFSEDLLREETPLVTGYSGDEKEDKGKILYVKKEGESGNGTYNGQEFTFDSNNAVEEYKHILRPFKSYLEQLDNGIIINYTLDNYVTIYCNIDGKYSIKSGYLTVPDKIGGISDGSITNITFEDQPVQREKLSEKIAYYEGEKIQTKTFNYIYEAENNTKIYYGADNRFFRLNKDLERVYLEDLTSPVYKKYSIPKTTGNNIEYMELYQKLSDGEIYTKDSDKKYVKAINTYGINADCRYYDYSSINYCVESYVFTSWITNLDGLPDELYIDSENDPEDKDSLFSSHKKEVIKSIVEESLNQAITSYSRNSSGEYQLPELSELDWDQILTNVSITTFVQGIPIGLKYYDNYAIATSTLNKEYVDPDEIYLNASGDNYYHMPYCTHLGEADLIGYRSIDYVRKSYSDDEDEEMNYYYFKHEDNGETIDVDQSCYYCLVEKSQYAKNKETTDLKEKAYYTALLRERYMTRKISNVYGQVDEIVPEPDEIIKYTLTFNCNCAEIPNNMPNPSAIQFDAETEVNLSEYPEPTRENYEFVGWSTSTSNGDIVDSIIMNSNKMIYAIWEEKEEKVIEIIYKYRENLNSKEETDVYYVASGDYTTKDLGGIYNAAYIWKFNGEYYKPGEQVPKEKFDEISQAVFEAEYITIDILFKKYEDNRYTVTENNYTNENEVGIFIQCKNLNGSIANDITNIKYLINSNEYTYDSNSIQNRRDEGTYEIVVKEITYKGKKLTTDYKENLVIDRTNPEVISVEIRRLRFW